MNGDSTAMPPAARDPSYERRATRRRWLIIALILLLALYIASPYYAFWRFTVALRAGDATQLERTVDFPSVRKSLRKQLSSSIAAFRPQNPKRQKMFDAISSALGPSVIDSLLDAYMTPEGLAAFLANPTIPGVTPPRPGSAIPGAVAPAPRDTSQATIDRHIDWSKVHYAFFTSPRDFLVDAEGTKLRFRFNGLRWRLKEVELDVSKLKL